MKKLLGYLVILFASAGLVLAQDGARDSSQFYVVRVASGLELDLSNSERLEVCDNFSGSDCRMIQFVAWEILYQNDPEITIDEGLGVSNDKHVPTFLTFNSQIENDLFTSREDWIVFCHSGRGFDVNGACEQYRQFFEGSRWSPSAERRAEKLTEVTDGEHYIFIPSSNGESIAFVIQEAVFVTEDQLEVARENDMATHGAVRTLAYDIFLEQDQRGVRDLMLIFCSSNGSSDPTDRYESRYILLLRPISD